jgi:3-phenylpropionate/trans-cinnamate dioxygenase ferredoxin reductase component
MKHFDVLIAGAGHGAAQAAIALRQRGFTGTIAMAGQEPNLPYERPALSKEYLAGDRPWDRLLIRTASFWEEKQIEVLTNTRVVAVNDHNRDVGLADGSVIHYEKLIWATGGHARHLSCSGHGLKGVHTVRSRGDVDRMRQELQSTDHIAIVGGGYIGLETAAILRKLGKEVTVIEAQERLLSRVAGEFLSRFYELQHRQHGVQILLGQTVECIEEFEGQCSGVRLAGGKIIPAQMVVVGIGILPLVEPLLTAGADGDNGVAVDEHCRTTLQHVYAIGDCALHYNAFAGGRRLRVESVQNATDMAATAVRSILGTPEPYLSVPWFWSNQYDLRLQTIGLSIEHEDFIVRGDPSNKSFSVVYRKDGRVVALDCINSAKDYVQGRVLVQHRIKAEADQLADLRIPLKSLAGQFATGKDGEAAVGTC